ncbi:MAG TPA: hypothetical protein VKM55_17415 [Candidatus Lokiarchaeia archaeon]|nr:hypothetical protein [Candidatus Lokiarchaeia archaeon]
MMTTKIILRFKDDEGNHVRKRTIKLDKHANRMIDFMINSLGVDPRDLKENIKERIMGLLERISYVWDTLEHRYRMSFDEIIGKCKHDDIFRGKVKAAFFSELHDVES